MERFNESPQLESLPLSEEEAVVRAEEMFGSLPEWYRQNKEIIDRNRVIHDEWSDTITEEVRGLMERLSNIT